MGFAQHFIGKPYLKFLSEILQTQMGFLLKMKKPLLQGIAYFALSKGFYV